MLEDIIVKDTRCR